MKHFVLTALAALSALACSCSKDGAAMFEGNYSFKTSGIVHARTVPNDGGEAVEITMKLPTESGQMDITPSGSGNKDLIVTMNVTGGDMVVMDASAEGDSLVLVPDRRIMQFSSPEFEDEDGNVFGGRRVELDLTVTGSGHRYENIILFRFRYEGTFIIGETEYEIYDSDVDCRAKLN